MPDLSQATVESVEATLRRLSESNIVRVRYFGFPPADLADHGHFHASSMGVELALDEGEPVFLTWGDAFGHFGLEAHSCPAESLLRNEPESIDITSHAWWQPFVGQKAVATAVWRTGVADVPDPMATPVAVELSASDVALWVVAAEVDDWPRYEPDDRWRVGVDDVVVTNNQRLLSTWVWDRAPK